MEYVAHQMPLRCGPFISSWPSRPSEDASICKREENHVYYVANTHKKVSSLHGRTQHLLDSVRLSNGATFKPICLNIANVGRNACYSLEFIQFVSLSGMPTSLNTLALPGCTYGVLLASQIQSGKMALLIPVPFTWWGTLMGPPR